MEEYKKKLEDLKNSLEKDLLWCPFCGDKGAFIGEDERFMNSIFYVSCPKCNATVGEFTAAEGASEAWNRRVICP